MEGSHRKMVCPVTRRQTSVDMHYQQIDITLMKRICRQAGYTMQAFYRAGGHT